VAVSSPHSAALGLQLRCSPNPFRTGSSTSRTGHRLLHPGLLAISVSEQLEEEKVPLAGAATRCWSRPGRSCRSGRRRRSTHGGWSDRGEVLRCRDQARMLMAGTGLPGCRWPSGDRRSPCRRKRSAWRPCVRLRPGRRSGIPADRRREAGDHRVAPAAPCPVQVLALPEVPPVGAEALRRRVPGNGPEPLRQRDADLHLRQGVTRFAESLAQESPRAPRTP
jgi:hypothetical protein